MLDFVLIYFCTKNSFAVISIYLCDFCIFKSHMNTKLTFEVGPGPLISPVRQGPFGLNWALLGDSPKCRIPPIDLSSSLQ